MAQDTTVIFAVAAIAFVLVVFLIGFLFMIFDSLDDAPTPTPMPTTSSRAGGGAAGKPVNMTSVFGGGSGKKRLYSVGVRLEEFLEWSIKEAPDALVAYCSQMEGDDREALFTELPKVINHVLGLDRGPDMPRGWLVGLDRYVDGPDKNDKDAQHIGGKFLDLLSGSPATTTNNGSSSSSGGGSSRGRLFEKLVDPGRGPESGMRYQFPDSGIYANMMPQQAQLALKANRAHLVPRFFAERIQAPFLVLNAWEYYLFCFCLWPLSDAGDHSLSKAPPAPTGGANAAAGYFGMVGGGPTKNRGPMYHQLLCSYLEHFVPAGQPMKAERGQLLLDAIAHFWISQNAAPAVLSQFGPLGKDSFPSAAPPGSVLGEFKETNASILGCLDKVVTHLNEHECKRRAASSPSSALAAPSAHKMLMPHFYHYFASQMSKLPDISSRVIQLARLLIKYLEPWRPTPKSGGAAGGASSGGGGGGGANGSGVGGGGGGGGQASLLESEAARPVMSAAAKMRLAESWEWASFVRDNYFLYVRVLVRMANEVKGVSPTDGPTDKPKPRFMIREQKRDREMLVEFAALFGNDKLLTLMKGLGEALEQLQHGTLPASAPEHKALVGQLQQLEPLDQSRWKSACADYMPSKVYEALDGMDEYLQHEQAIMKKEQANRGALGAMGGGASASKNSPMAVVDELRRVAQKAMRELQPEGAEVVVQRKIVQMEHPQIGLLDTAAAATPLSADQKDRIRAGRARCSALNVGYRATPRLPVRPVGKYEVTSLVELAEKVGGHWPTALTQYGFHPRFLANVPSLVLCTVYAFLLAVRPTPSSAEPGQAGERGRGDDDVDEAYVVLLILWLMVLTVSLAMGGLYLRHWARRHKPSLRATAESWVPWVAEQLQRGVGEYEIKEYLLRTALPSDAVADAAEEADRMLALAKRRARWSHN